MIFVCFLVRILMRLWKLSTLKSTFYQNNHKHAKIGFELWWENDRGHASCPSHDRIPVPSVEYLIWDLMFMLMRPLCVAIYHLSYRTMLECFGMQSLCLLDLSIVGNKIWFFLVLRWLCLLNILGQGLIEFNKFQWRDNGSVMFKPSNFSSFVRLNLSKSCRSIL